MADFPTWEAAASRCSGKVQPGSAELMAWAVETYGKRGLRNWGIYNCRTTVGGTNRSIHGDGRACDFGFPLVNNRANPVGWEVVNALLPHVRALGIQMIIWDRRIWSARTPNGAPYGGSGKSPHIDHIHVEQTWNSARTLTRERVRQIVRVPAPKPPAPTPAPKPPPPAPAPPVDQEDDDDMATFIRLGQPNHRHTGRVEAVTSMHRRWVPKNELDLFTFLGGDVIECPNVAAFNAWTSNKVALGTNPINGPI